METNEINALKAQLEALQNRLNELEAGQAPMRSGRRGMLKLAAGAAAGAVVGAVAGGANPAAAADGDPITAGQSTSTTAADTDSTTLVYANTIDAPMGPGTFTLTVDTNAFLVRDISALVLGPEHASSYPAAVAGYANSVLTHGVYGKSKRSTGYGVVGLNNASSGGAGVLARGDHANLELDPFGTAPASRVVAYSLGQIVCDSSGDTWICVAAGTPGTWRKISGASTAGSFHAITPIRVYDSRQPGYSGYNGSLGRTASREVSVADARDGSGGVVAANAVPAGATAVAFNITVAGPTGDNYLSITPGGVATIPTTSIINFVTGQNVANASVVAISSDRKVKVWCGTMYGSTDFILDISGYYL